MSAIHFAHTEIRAGEAEGALSAGERKCLERFRAPTRRDSFIAGRRAAKLALCELLGETMKLEILTGPAGEPRVNIPGFGVSIAHSGNMAAAVAYRTKGWDAPGLDLERIRPVDRETADLFCAPEELEKWSEENGPFLLRLWTAKEAVFKAAVPQRSLDLRDIRFENAPGEYLVESAVFGEYLVALALPWSRSHELDGVLPLTTEASQLMHGVSKVSFMRTRNQYYSAGR